MRTKLILAAALAVGALSAVAQSNVYSLNVVGYVNIPIQGGNALTMVSVPLQPMDGNYNVTNTMPAGAFNPDVDGANLYHWAGTSWDNNIPGWFAGFGWFPDMTIAAGNAFFVQSPVASTLTIVGQVEQGTLSQTFGTGFNLIGNRVPIAEPFPGFSVGHDGDNMYLWTGSAWDNTIWAYFADYGWFGTGAAGESTNGPVVPIGSGVFYQNLGAPVNWTRTFNVQ